MRDVDAAAEVVDLTAGGYRVSRYVRPAHVDTVDFANDILDRVNIDGEIRKRVEDRAGCSYSYHSGSMLEDEATGDGEGGRTVFCVPQGMVRKAGKEWENGR